MPVCVSSETSVPAQKGLRSPVSRKAERTTSVTEAHSCHSDADCNYNGRCSKPAMQKWKCACDAQWRGDACDVLNLVSVDKKTPLGYRGTSEDGTPVSSWGGSVVAGDDGLFHMYASEIVGGCGMNVWLSNSQVIHATSSDPVREPFVKRDIVAPAFAHEPMAARAPSGEFVVWYTAVLPPGKLPVMGGEACAGCSDGNSVASCGTDGNRNASVNLPTYMVYSTHPGGPWSDPQLVPGTDVFADSNFAPVIKDDGSLVALSRSGVWTAPDWRDVESYRQVDSWEDRGEDPMVWIDRRGVFHCIVHVNRIETTGLVYYSLDGLTWIPSGGGGHAYEHVVQYTDGSSVAFGCRERPHIVQNREGDIIALTTGSSPVTCHSTEEPVSDYSYTLLQVVGQEKRTAEVPLVMES
uniref:EGF-like domain-containing protein n=1 Tax=Chromera velia CCMP2878 TaxID=1169474 RepID=A0A0G4I0M9_9ALVE|eukprot:Cvel_9985.t1-p1 / transcript=Cvel_9985.t1 / gene=Cvel_9985 / organism=Chromera_velia_CCMP2878 / gene_product=hypothetical protein / transcript_product=hypothetical protein / location=Cvel_scaffold591:10871-12336(+) / protein_length=408 / sequence_SO=supercontig / SO=protein_coding / is_pseudo=false